MEERKRQRERKSAAYWLSKCSVLYPIGILYVMYVKQVEVYITELSVHVSAGTMLFAYALCLILWLASPIRSYCADGTGNEILFHAFLPNILMLFLFAQYSLKIVLFLAALDGMFLITVLRDLHRKKGKYSPKKFWRLKRSDINTFLFVSVCVCMVPTCMMIYQKFESPSEAAELYEREKNYNLVQNQETIFGENKEFLLSLKESEWSQKTLKERISDAQRMIQIETKRLGIPEIPLRMKEIESLNCIALYTNANEQKEIWYDPGYLSSQTAEEFFTTICEECYHGMEHYLIEHMDWSSEIANTVYFDEMRKWKINIDHYVSGDKEGESFEAYHSQPLEASAKKYASSETEALIHFIAVYGNK